MSITYISTKIKQLVLVKLLDSGENIIDASSKSGLSVEFAKKYLSTK
ncbi:hypothetical protein ACNSOO_05675 [Aliarcobacter lanthieri]|nr:hypothetical protein [Aliarcobacter lanthieri]